MVDLIGEIEKGLKKVTDFLEVTPTELHHSEPYNSPRGHIGQAIPSEKPTPILSLVSPQAKTPTELEYLRRQENFLNYARKRRKEWW